MSDPRRADVDGIARMLARVEAGEEVELPSLLAIDLIVAGGARQAVVELEAWRTWSGLDDGTRATVTVASLVSLARRGLLDIPDPAAAGGAGTFDLPLRPPLALILAARTRPVVIAAPWVDGGQGAVAFRAYGIGDAGRPLRACVVEKATRRRADLGEAAPWAPNRSGPAEPGDLNRVYVYRLQPPAGAAGDLAAWAVEPAEAPPGQAWPPPRVVDIVRHYPEQAATRERLAVEGDGVDAVVTWTRGDGVEFPPSRYDRRALSDAIASLMAA